MTDETGIVKYGETGEVYDVEYTEVQPTPPQRSPWTLWIGLVILLGSAGLLATDVWQRGGEVMGRDVLTADQLIDPSDPLTHVARWAAVNFTPIVWVGALFFIEGLLTRLAWKRGDVAGSCVRRRPWLFAMACVASVPIWCAFDLMNFYVIGSWRYIGMPDPAAQRYVGYFIAFGAICPAMFMLAQLFQKLGLREFKTRTRLSTSPVLAMAMLLAGAAMLALPFVFWEKIDIWRDHLPMSGQQAAVMFAINAGLWIAPILILDPINVAQKRPSLLQDWSDGRWGRTVSLMLAGLVCGLLWEVWNYWAVAKWQYQLEFLGPLADLRYFEMPLVGLAGFLPFAPACWVIFQSILGVLPSFGEDLPDKYAIL